ncbi:MAG TPA: methylated-DNA--[protein]-cysteine S-methyltransferase [Flavobacteriales bacterium]
MIRIHAPAEPELFGPMHVGQLECPLGRIFVECDGERITRISFRNPGRGRGGRMPRMLQEALFQLDAYFAGRRKKFDLPLYRVGSAYRRAVWEQLDRIPHGSAITYEELASSVGGNARSVGSACTVNPLLIVVPCHRVVGKSGLLMGWAGEIWRKKWLLQHEGVLPPEAEER